MITPVRDALRGLLRELAGGATVLEADWRQTMRLIEQNPDLHMILFDLNLGHRDGLVRDFGAGSP
jgi:hypothetical protein